MLRTKKQGLTYANYSMENNDMEENVIEDMRQCIYDYLQ